MASAAPKGLGRAQRAASVRAASRTPAAVYPDARALPTPTDRVEVAALLIRPGLQPPVVSLDGMVEELTWGEDGANADQTDPLSVARTTGSLTLRRPDMNDPGSLLVDNGYQLRIQVRWAEQWRRVDDLRIYVPDNDVVGGTGTVDLKDDMDLLRRLDGDWVLRAPKGHPGWRTGEVALWALGHSLLHGKRPPSLDAPVPVDGKVPRGEKVWKTLNLQGQSLYNVLLHLYTEEFNETGTWYDLRMVGGAVRVAARSRNPVAYVISDQLTAFTYSRSQGANPVTGIRAKGRLGKGKHAKVLRHTVAASDAVRHHFGSVWRTQDFGRVSGIEELKMKAERRLVWYLRRRVTVQCTVPLLPFLHRGDCVVFDYPEEGFKGDDRFLFVSTVGHRAAAGAGFTDLELTWADTFERYRKVREAKIRANARRARAKKKAPHATTRNRTPRSGG